MSHVSPMILPFHVYESFLSCNPGFDILHFESDASHRLQSYRWPANVEALALLRLLRTVQRLYLLTDNLATVKTLYQRGIYSLRDLVNYATADSASHLTNPTLTTPADWCVILLPPSERVH